MKSSLVVLKGLKLVSFSLFHTSIVLPWPSFVAQLVKNPPAVQETWVYPWVGKIPWGRGRLPTPVFWPGELHGLYNPWSRKELDMAEQLPLHLLSYLNLLVQFWPQSLFHGAMSQLIFFSFS